MFKKMLMKKLFAVLCALFFIIPSANAAFRDISQNSKLQPILQDFEERGVLSGKGFFRPDDNVPAKMLLEVLFRDAGFDPNSADFNTPLPPNIDESDTLAPFVREAIRRGFLTADEEFDTMEPITRLEAIRGIVKTKGIMIPKSVSTTFKNKTGGVSPLATYLKDIEPAYASKILEDSDVDPLRPFDYVTRRDFVTWIARFHKQELRISSLESPVKEKQERKSSSRYRRGTPEKTSINDSRIKIEILNGVDELSMGSGIRIPNGSILEAVYRAIDAKYKFQDELTDDKKKKMVDAAVTAMVKALDDKYSSYIEPEKVAEFKEGLDGKFEGIGAYVEMIEDHLTITSPIKGSPAEDAGIEPGDIVVKVDGESIKGMNIRESIDLIRGQEGTKVELGILRDGMDRVIVVTRGKITVPSITIEWKNSVPIIGIHQFNRNTASDFLSIWNKEVKDKSPRGLIIDLRNNPGGFLTSAVEMGEIFLKRGQLIFTVEHRDGIQEYRSSKEGELSHFDNIVVLQNNGSASASEIFTGMIQDYGIGKIVGKKSVGKGTVQEISNFSNGSSLKLTVAKWLTPNGRWIHEEGVVPEVEVENPTIEEKRKKIDHQIDAAVREILNR